MLLFSLASIDGDVSIQCEEGDVKTYFAATDSSTIRVQQGLFLIIFSWQIKLKLYLGDVEVAVIDTSNVRLNLVGKRVQISEDAEHFHRHTSKKLGIVHVQGKTID